jgi:hypothetical protein
MVDTGMPTSVDINGVNVPVADGKALCPDCLANGFRRTIAGHKHDSAVKVRTGECCPLCGGPFHGRQIATDGLDLYCAWRQWAKAAYGRSSMAPTPSNVADFNAWLQANPTLPYGKAAQYVAWAQMQGAGTFAGKLSPAMAADMDRTLNPKRGAKVTGQSDPQGPSLPAPTVVAPAPTVASPELGDILGLQPGKHVVVAESVPASVASSPSPTVQASEASEARTGLTREQEKALKRKLQAMDR